jgi:hypothetical protein
VSVCMRESECVWVSYWVCVSVYKCVCVCARARALIMYVYHYVFISIKIQVTLRAHHFRNGRQLLAELGQHVRAGVVMCVYTMGTRCFTDGWIHPAPRWAKGTRRWRVDRTRWASTHSGKFSSLRWNKYLKTAAKCVL